MLRLGARGKVRAEIDNILPEKVVAKKSGEVNGGSLLKAVNNARVVACTCLSVGKNTLLNEQKFDIVIVDEVRGERRGEERSDEDCDGPNSEATKRCEYCAFSARCFARR